MKKFIYKTLWFFFALPLFFIFLVFFNNKTIDWKEPETKTVAIIGTSIPTHAYDDKIIESLTNLSSDGESYFYNYYKLKESLKYNPQINTVLIEFDNGSLIGDKDRWIWGEKTIAGHLPKTLPFIDMEGMNLILKNNPRAMLNALGAVFKEEIKLGIKSLIYGGNYKKLRIGGYLPKYENKIVEAKKRLTENSELSNRDFTTLSEDNLNYLMKIIKLCEENEIKVFLIRTPMHELYEGYNYENFFEQNYNKYLSATEFLDLRNFPIQESEYLDLTHLNHTGAKKLSYFLDDLIKTGLLEKTNKTDFIQKSIAAYKDSE